MQGCRELVKVVAEARAGLAQAVAGDPSPDLSSRGPSVGAAPGVASCSGIGVWDGPECRHRASSGSIEVAEETKPLPETVDT